MAKNMSGPAPARADTARRSRVRDALLRSFLKTSSKKEFLDQAVRLVRDGCGCGSAGIRALDEWENIPFVSSAGYGEKFLESECWLSIREDQCVCIRAVTGRMDPQDTPVVTDDGAFRINNFPEYFLNLEQAQKTRFRGVCLTTGYRSVAVVPLRYQGRILGAIHLADSREGAFPPEKMKFVESVAPIIGEGIYRFHVEDRLQRNYDIQSALASLLRLSLDNISVDETMRRAIDIVHSAPRSVFGTKVCLFLAEGERGLVMKAQGGIAPETREKCAVVKFGDCLCGRAAESRQTQFASSATGHDLNSCQGDDPHRHYSVPVIFNSATLGVVHAYFQEGHRRDPREEEFLTAVANTLAGIIVRKRAEDELRGLSQRLVQLQEEERRTIGRELHDEIGQSMTVLMLALDAVKHAAPRNRGSALAEAEEVATEVMTQVRNLSLQLHCAMLEQGLLPTLQWYVERYGAQTKLKIDFQHSGLDREIPKEVSAGAYRIVQESLTNVVRYARVKEVAVQVRADKSSLHLEVEDHGAGFDPSIATAGTSTGLQGMRERAFLLGGKLEIRSAPGAGTCVSAELPLPPPPA